jgi:dimethylargininase
VVDPSVQVSGWTDGNIHDPGVTLLEVLTYGISDLIALTRSLPPSIVDCELTHLEREPIDLARAEEQHSLYEKALVEAGCTIHRLPFLPDLPDSVFVEDTAVVLPELAIVARPGAESRRSEVTSVAEALRPCYPLAFIESPGTLDGGDVLPIGSTIYVGESTRTNADGIRQLAEITSAHGYRVRSVKVSGCLHLKSAVTRVGDDVILLNSAWIDSSSFPGLHQIEVHPGEPSAANALWIGDIVIYSASYDQTRQRLEKRGINVDRVETDELEKAEGAVTCCSILIPKAV